MFDSLRDYDTYRIETTKDLVMFQTQLDELVRSVGPAETFFSICSQTGANQIDLCNYFVDDASKNEDFVMKLIRAFLWGVKFGDDDGVRVLRHAFRGVVEKAIGTDDDFLSSMMSMLSFGLFDDSEKEEARKRLNEASNRASSSELVVRQQDVPGDGDCFYYALYRAIKDKDELFPIFVDQFEEVYGIDVKSERAFIDSMRDLVADALEGVATPELNQLAELALKYSFDVSQRDASKDTCIPHEKISSMEKFRNHVVNKIRTTKCYATNLETSIAGTAASMGGLIEVNLLAIGSSATPEMVSRPDAIYLLNVGIENNPNHFVWLKAIHPRPEHASSSVNVSYPAPEARGEKLPVKGFKFRRHKQQQLQKLDIVDRLVKGEGTRPPVPPDILATVKKHVKEHLAIKPLTQFIDELKTFKVKETTKSRKETLEYLVRPGENRSRLPPEVVSKIKSNVTRRNYEIRFPKVLKYLFPTVSWQDLDQSYEDNRAYQVGKLDIDYDMLVSKLEVMGQSRGSYYGTGSGKNQVFIYNDGFTFRFGRNFRKMFGRTMTGIEFETDPVEAGGTIWDNGIKVVIFVSSKMPSIIKVLVQSPEVQED